MRGELGFDSFTANIAVLDSAGRIVAVNPAWRAFGEKNGLKHPDACLGANYLEVCKASNVPRELIEELSDLLGGRQSVLSHWYPCHAPDRKRWFIMFGVRQAESHTVALFHVEVTDWMGPSTVEQLDFEKPDRLIDNRIQLSVEAALARLLPALLGKIDRGGHRTPRAGIRRDISQDIKSKLTKRQTEILVHLGSGRSNAEIAELISASPNTVKLHVSAILKRLNFKKRAQAVALGAKLQP